MKLIALLLAIVLSACAITRSPASDAAVADTVSTGAAMALGAVELNPLGLLVLPAKVALLAHIETLPEGERQIVQSQLSAIWNGAAVNNACVALTMLSSGLAGFPCLILGGAYGMWEYTTVKAEQMQQEFLAMCLQAKQNNPAMRCFYKGNEVGQ
jgi:hypothetical protein